MAAKSREEMLRTRKSWPRYDVRNHRITTTLEPPKLTMFEFWASIRHAFRAKEYMLAAASQMYTGPKGAQRATGVQDSVLYSWRKRYPHWDTVEKALFNDPRYAADFIGAVAEAQALYHFKKILDGTEPGNKERAALRLLTHAERHRPPRDVPDEDGDDGTPVVSRLPKLVEDEGA